VGRKYTMVRFTASGLLDGNKLFADEIIFEENSVTIKSQRLFGGKQTSFPNGKMAVSIKDPINGFCEVDLTTENGKSVGLYGFAEHEAKLIKNLIQEKNIQMDNSKKNNYRETVQKSMPDNGEDMMQYGVFLHRVDQLRKKALSVKKESDTKAEINTHLKEETACLIRFYKEANFEIVDDEEEIDNNIKIAGIFIRDCLTKSGRGRIRDVIQKMKEEEKHNEYTAELELLLALIDNIYNSLVYKELDAENKQRFPFGLDKQKIKDLLADHTVPENVKMSRILRRVDSFISRIVIVL